MTIGAGLAVLGKSVGTDPVDAVSDAGGAFDVGFCVAAMDLQEPGEIGLGLGAAWFSGAVDADPVVLVVGHSEAALSEVHRRRGSGHSGMDGRRLG